MGVLSFSCPNQTRSSRYHRRSTVLIRRQRHRNFSPERLPLPYVLPSGFPDTAEQGKCERSGSCTRSFWPWLRRGASGRKRRAIRRTLQCALARFTIRYSSTRAVPVERGVRRAEGVQGATHVHLNAAPSSAHLAQLALRRPLRSRNMTMLCCGK